MIESIERQGRVEIGTNADPATLVTIRLNRAPLFEAIDTLAVRIDADARLAYIAAPTGSRSKAVLTAFSSGANPGDWMVFSALWGEGCMVGDLSAVDPRRHRVENHAKHWSTGAFTHSSTKVRRRRERFLRFHLGWNPLLSKVALVGRVGKVTANLIRTAKGTVKELFLLTVQVFAG